jgi:hypothetical protein
MTGHRTARDGGSAARRALRQPPGSRRRALSPAAFPRARARPGRRRLLPCRRRRGRRRASRPRGRAGSRTWSGTSRAASRQTAGRTPGCSTANASASWCCFIAATSSRASFTPPGGVAASMRRAQRSQGPQGRTPERSGGVDGASTSRKLADMSRVRNERTVLIDALNSDESGGWRYQVGRAQNRR